MHRRGAQPVKHLERVDEVKKMTSNRMTITIARNIILPF